MKVPTPRKLSSGNWFIQLRLGGESIPVTADSEKECIKQAEYVKAEYRNGKRQPKEAEPEKLPTVGAVIDEYIRSKSNILSPSTIRGYQTIRKNRFQSVMDSSLSDLSESDWLHALNHESSICSPKTVTNAWRFIATALNVTAKYKLPDAQMPQIPHNERLFLDPDQIKKFTAAVKGTDIEIVALLALSSLRRSEICALRWENVDLKNRRILVSGAAVFDENNKLVQKKTNKNRSSTRYVPILMDELYSALEREQKESGLIAAMYPNTMNKKVLRICKENDLPHVTLHGLRHSFASLCYHLNVPEKIVMEIGGWADNQTMRKIYTHIAKSDVTKYTSELTQFFKNANENANEK